MHFVINSKLGSIRHSINSCKILATYIFLSWGDCLTLEKTVRSLAFDESGM